MMADHPLMHTHPKSIISLAYNEKDIFSLFVVSGHTLNQIRAHYGVQLRAAVDA